MGDARPTSPLPKPVSIKSPQKSNASKKFLTIKCEKSGFQRKCLYCPLGGQVFGQGWTNSRMTLATLSEDVLELVTKASVVTLSSVVPWTTLV